MPPARWAVRAIKLKNDRLAIRHPAGISRRVCFFVPALLPLQLYVPSIPSVGNGKIAFRLISATHRRPPQRTNARADGRLVSAHPVIVISDTVSLRPCAFGARAHTRRTLRAAARPLDSAFLHPLSSPLRLTAAHRSARMRTDGRLHFSLPFPLSYRFPLTVCRPDDHSLFILSKNLSPSLSVINTEGSYAGSR